MKNSNSSNVFSGRMVSAAMVVIVLPMLILSQVSADRGGEAGTIYGDPGRGNGDPSREFALFQLDRGSTRMVQLYRNIATVYEFTTVTSGWEVDVSAITIQSGFNSLDGPTGTFAVVFDIDLGPSFVHYFDIQEPGTTHYGFDPPLPLRSGDMVSWTPTSGAHASQVQISFHGTIPVPAGLAVR